MKVGLTGDPGTFLGPVQNKLQYQVVRGFIEDSKANGYRFALGNPHELSSKGYFINPIVIDNPPDNSKIVREEPFGESLGFD
jgi:acyl-CoA reductase-like NAD-dependent aldehyde dehydrogenase